MESHALHTIHPNVRQVMEPPPMDDPYMLTAYRVDKRYWGLRDVYANEEDAVVAAQHLPAHWTFYRIYKLEL